MNESIKRAIESICDDIATNTNADDNKARAEAVASLTFSGLFVPEEIEGDDEAMQQDEPQTIKKVPAAGEHFNYNGIEFIALGEEQGGLLAVVAHEFDKEYAFDKDNKNDWRKSSLRKFLNEDYIEQLNRGDLLPFVSDLTADDGTTDYGTSEDYIFMLSDNLRRKYRPYLPKYDNWVWSITPYSCIPSFANYARIVDTDGSLSSSIAFLSNGVAPACLFNPKIFE